MSIVAKPYQTDIDGLTLRRLNAVKSHLKSVYRHRADTLIDRWYHVGLTKDERDEIVSLIRSGEDAADGSINAYSRKKVAA